jgi:hypothetical protein
MARFIAVTLLTLAGSAIAGLPYAVAQSEPSPPRDAPAPGTDDGRYSFHRIGDNFVRLDSRTGQVAQCGWSNLGWSCKLVADERAALESEIARLQRDNAVLKKSLLSRGIELPAGMVAEAPAAGPVPPANVPDPSAKTEPKMPSDAELDRAFAFMKKIWRRLVDMMTDMQRDMEREKKS